MGANDDLALEAQLAAIQKRSDTLTAAQLGTLYQGLVSQELARCAHDGQRWLRYVTTKDEADSLRPVKPFPLDLPYLLDLWSIIHLHQALVIAKSRQMLLSWLLACYCVWRARFKPNQAIYWQTKAWDDAVAMVAMPAGGVMGRCQFIEENLPPWMRVAYKPSEGRIQYPNGSLIQALAGGGDKIRGKVVSVLVEDEFAHQEDQEGVHTAVLPLIQKGAKVIFVSSPNQANLFCTLYHGYPMGQAPTSDVVAPA